MENVFDFIRAAAPWVAMGLLLAIFAVRSAAKKKKGHEQEPDTLHEGQDHFRRFRSVQPL